VIPARAPGVKAHTVTAEIIKVLGQSASLARVGLAGVCGVLAWGVLWSAPVCGQPREATDEELGELLGGPSPEGATEEGAGGFFDPAKLVGARTLRINGTLDATVFAPTGPSRLGEFGFAEAGVGLYFGAPVYEDRLYASVALETGAHTGSGGARLSIETAQLTWAPVTELQVVAGLFLVPFGLEDGDHASPQNPLVTRPLSFAGAVVYPGTWSDAGVSVEALAAWAGSLRVYVVAGNLVHRRSDLREAQGFVNQAQGLVEGLETVQQAHSFSGNLQSRDATTLRSYGARLRLNKLVSGLDVGGSAIAGQHGRRGDAIGLELWTWGLGAHVDLELGVMLAGVLGAVWPLPQVRAELVVLQEDRAVPVGPDFSSYAWQGRGRSGGYVLVVQPLVFDVDLVARYDEFEPDTGESGDRGLELSVGLRWRPAPGVFLKLEGQFTDAQGRAQTGGNSVATQAAVAW